MSEPEEDDAPPPKSGGNKLMMVVLVANLLGLGGLGAYLVLARGEGKAHAAPAPEPELGTRVGPLVPMDPLIVNLADAAPEDEGPRYLKITIQLEASTEASRVVVESTLVPIRSRVIVRLASLTGAETRGSESLVKLQGELRRLVNELLGSPRVRRVFFTEFVVQ